MGRGNLVFSSHFVILVSRKNNFNMNWWFVFLFISIATLFPRIDSSEMSCAVCGDSPGKWNEIADRSICSLMDHFWNDSHDYFNEATNSRNFNYWPQAHRSEEHTSELQSRGHLVCRLLLEKKK